MLQQRVSSDLADAFGGAGHRVVQAVILADGSPQLCVRAVLLQRVGAFVPEVVVDSRVSYCAIVHLNLPRQVLEGPAAEKIKSFHVFFLLTAVNQVRTFTAYQLPG